MKKLTSATRFRAAAVFSTVADAMDEKVSFNLFIDKNFGFGAIATSALARVSASAVVAHFEKFLRLNKKFE
ncbi:12530_t:CDS:2 [Dentiscutata heterogama]|uniref:12530_t:CDS:1 n=1 Tax=Dentiscutata heterogama TaxID=1316150 RepID=A0ACA9K471_9GLOM|nr:12530_t:CDS:2 [Dentiscutata heterogama]